MSLDIALESSHRTASVVPTVRFPEAELNNEESEEPEVVDEGGAEEDVDDAPFERLK